MEMMLNFVWKNRSLSMVLFSACITGIIAVPSFVSLIVHILNLGLLFGLRYMAFTEANNKLTPILILLSVGLTAVVTEPTEIRLLFQGLNFLLLVGVWGVSIRESDAQKLIANPK